MAELKVGKKTCLDKARSAITYITAEESFKHNAFPVRVNTS